MIDERSNRQDESGVGIQGTAPDRAARSSLLRWASVSAGIGATGLASAGAAVVQITQVGNYVSLADGGANLDLDLTGDGNPNLPWQSGAFGALPNIYNHGGYPGEGNVSLRSTVFSG